jgi:hypothetical protein
MHPAAIGVIIAIALFVGGIIAREIYLRVHHRPSMFLDEECVTIHSPKQLKKAYYKHKRKEEKEKSKV